MGNKQRLWQPLPEFVAGAMVHCPQSNPILVLQLMPLKHATTLGLLTFSSELPVQCSYSRQMSVKIMRVGQQVSALVTPERIIPLKERPL